MGHVLRLGAALFLLEESCNVYAVVSGRCAVLIEAGSGAILDFLADLGVERVTDVLCTHLDRDSVEGLQRLSQHGARLWAPVTEQEQFLSLVREHSLPCQFRFLEDYQTLTLEACEFQVVPTPGHTTGSVSFVLEMNGKRHAFTGDLLSGPGTVVSLAATQWSYNGGEGLVGSILSLLDLRDRRVEVLLPTHGHPMGDAEAAIDLTVGKLWQLVSLRRHNPRLFQFRERPFEEVTRHLLNNRTAFSYQYFLLSEAGKALAIDFGYDFFFGRPAGTGRATRRPWLYNISTLKREFGVTSVDVVLPTHYHDDHVAGINLLRAVEGTQVWVPEVFADVLASPEGHLLPCRWFDPIPADRVLSLDEPFTWEEYELRLHHLPGHTFYAVAVEFVVDGKRVLAAGDQFSDPDGLGLNYVYENIFDPTDYLQSARLLERVRPDLIVSGHGPVLQVTPDFLAQLAARGRELERLHAELLARAEGRSDT